MKKKCNIDENKSVGKKKQYSKNIKDLSVSSADGGAGERSSSSFLQKTR